MKLYWHNLCFSNTCPANYVSLQRYYNIQMKTEFLSKLMLYSCNLGLNNCRVILYNLVRTYIYSMYVEMVFISVTKYPWLTTIDEALQEKAEMLGRHPPKLNDNFFCNERNVDSTTTIRNFVFEAYDDHVLASVAMIVLVFPALGV